MPSPSPLPDPPPALPAVAAVVVTYRYPAVHLQALLRTLSPVVARVYLVDNNDAGAGSPDATADLGDLPETVDHLVNGANIGLAAALNRGIDAAFAAGFERVLLLDQDSRPEPAMATRLDAALTRLQRSRQRPAAVGAGVYDPRLRLTLPFVRFGWLGPVPVPAAGRSELPVDLLITSGTLLPADAWRRVGRMDEELFIDNIDVDWCLRAQAAGLALYGVPAARLRHYLGDRVQRVPLTGKQAFVHPPLRQYYIARNHVRLLRRDYVPWRWKISHAARLLYRVAFFSLCVPPRRCNCRMIIRGIWHGLHRSKAPAKSNKEI